VLDPRECRYVFVRQEDYLADCGMVRRRWRELRDAPPLHHCMRFPDRAFINDLLFFNRQYSDHVERQRGIGFGNDWALRETVCECNRLYAIWDTARDARCDYYYVTVRRGALKKLREMIGFPAYCSGCMPPHIPIWRFAKLD
jgi:hypothetical protein